MSENKNDFHFVSVYAVGQLKDDDTHYFEAFFKSKYAAEEYIKNRSVFLSIFDLHYYIPKDVYLKNGDFFTMPSNNGVKYAS